MLVIIPAKIDYDLDDLRIFRIVYDLPHQDHRAIKSFGHFPIEPFLIISLSHMNEVYLSLGSNEGDRMGWFEKALALIAMNCGTITKRSAVYETAAWGINEQPDFLNMTIGLQTDKTAHELLTSILDIETQLGRHRTIKWGPRTLDIDILFYDEQIIDTPELIVPHPFIQDRLFTLMPLADIAPDLLHPILNKTVSQLLAECPDKLGIHKYKEA